MVETGVGYVHGETFGARRVVFEVRDGLAVFEGDIVLGTAAEVSARSAVALPGASFRWPGGVIPYEIDPSLPEAQRSAAQAAVEHWNRVTRLALVPRRSEPDYVRFAPGGGCSSSVGRQGGAQELSLGTGCFFGQATHELGHAAGLWHEQSREDRDRFVTIVWDNVDPQQKHNFDQHITDGDDIGPYDYGSIMHYPAVSFSINGQPTIVPAQPGVAIGQRDALSPLDRAAIRALYPALEPSFENTAVGSAGVYYHLRDRWYLWSSATWTLLGEGPFGLVGDFGVLSPAGSLGRVVDGRLVWETVQPAPGASLSWVGRFGEGQRALVYADGNWWLGDSSEWAWAGNTEGFTADLSTLLVGDVDGDGQDELLVEDGGEWWCARFTGSEFEWSVVGESRGRTLGVTGGGLLVTDEATWRGTLVNGALAWARVGGPAPDGRLVGEYLVSPAGVWAPGWTPLGGGGDVAWALPGGELLTYTSLDASCRLYTPGSGWSFAATFEA